MLCELRKQKKTDWREAIIKYEKMYNTTPHSITGKALLELLTGRPIKGLLPSLRTTEVWNRDSEVKERDAIKKMKGKHYADRSRKSKQSGIKVGDRVRVWNYQQGKSEPNYGIEIFKVLRKVGNDTAVVSRAGVKYRRPVAHLSKVCDEETQQNNTISSQHKQQQKDKKEFKRPTRIRKIPNRYND